MRTLSNREKRTVRIGVIGVTVYLCLFGGAQVWKMFSHKRAYYLALVRQAETLKAQMQLYEDRTVTIKKLMEGFNMDPAKLYRTTVVAQASAAIQKAAMSSGGVQLGSVREAPGRSSNKELATIQLEAMGPVPALLRFLHQLDSVGYPLIIDSLQVGSDSARQGGQQPMPGMPGGPGMMPGMMPGGPGMMPGMMPGGPGMMPGGMPGGRGGPLKLSLTIAILDFDQWKKTEGKNAAS